MAVSPVFSPCFVLIPVLIADHPCDDAGWRRPAGPDSAGSAARTDPAGSEWNWADHASHAADHHQYRRNPANTGKILPVEMCNSLVSKLSAGVLA